MLSDSPVGGVSYSTSSGKSGTTNAQGEFDYTVGDTVTFTIGGLEIGKYTPNQANEIVTPVQLAETFPEADRENVVTNLLVLLQSLDEDGDPANGITISDSSTAKLAEPAEDTLDFTADPTYFADDVYGIVPEGNAVVTPEAARSHFADQYFKNLAGIYYTDDYNAVVRINSDGSYVQGQFGYDESAAELGIEWGSMVLNPLLATVTFNVDRDTQSGIGAGFDGSENDRFIPTLDGLRILTPDEDKKEHKLTRFVAESGDSIVGAWAVATTPTAYDPDNEIYTRIPVPDAEKKNDAIQFIFFENGTFMMLDAVGDDEGAIRNAPEVCGGPGVEKGTYTFSNNTLTITSKSVDTNGCGGIEGTLDVEIKGDTMTWDLEGYTIDFDLKRVVTHVD